MARERPRSGHRPTSAYLNVPITRRNFLRGSAALVVLTACGPVTEDPGVGPSGGDSLPTGDNGYLEDMLAEPGAPAIAGKEVVISSASKKFGTDPGTIYFTRANVAPNADAVIESLGPWRADTLTVSIPTEAPPEGPTDADLSAGPPLARFRITIEPVDGDSVHVDINVFQEIGGGSDYEEVL